MMTSFKAIDALRDEPSCFGFHFYCFLLLFSQLSHKSILNPIMSTYIDNTKSELRNQSKDAVRTAQNAVASRAWLYPIKGIVYFLSHRSCWGPFLKALPPVCYAVLFRSRVLC